MSVEQIHMDIKGPIVNGRRTLPYDHYKFVLIGQSKILCLWFEVFEVHLWFVDIFSWLWKVNFFFFKMCNNSQKTEKNCVCNSKNTKDSGKKYSCGNVQKMSYENNSVWNTSVSRPTQWPSENRRSHQCTKALLA